ncbi:MAG: HupE/UreJ family protein [Porticoccaceae bacterium]|nr:HupE/UreJ family protein [Porticoccaceae bacterium]
MPASVLKQIALVICLLTWLGLSGLCRGHALEPGYLEIRQFDSERYAVVWKKPAVAGKPMAISAKLPTQCQQNPSDEPVWDGRAYLSRWLSACTGGIEGGVIEITGLEHTATDVLVRLDLSDGRGYTHRLTPSEATVVIPARASQWHVAKTYLLYGIEHILLGVDHLLFVLALLLLVRGLGSVIATITAFTLAHSLTLAAATLELVTVPMAPIEAVIALSIAFVAAEIIHSQRGKPGLTSAWPWLVAFTFGLLHGFGFASALTDVGLPQQAIPLALLFFNIGVELGQLVFVASFFVVIAAATRVIAWLKLPLAAIRQRFRAASAYAIGSLAMFWVVERTLSFAV